VLEFIIQTIFFVHLVHCWCGNTDLLQLISTLEFNQGSYQGGGMT
jgi:hypothetical protein